MAKRTNDDLFEGTTMSFGEHLEELRVCLFRSLAGVAIGCVVGFFIANAVVRFFQSPLENAMRNYYLNRAMDELALEYPEGIPFEVQQMVIEDGLVPDRILMETSRLLERLGDMYDLPLQITISSYQFIPDDIKPGAERILAKRLLEGEKAKQGSPEALLWSKLDPQDREFLKDLAAGEGDAKLDERQQLVEVMNKLIANPKLAESKPFASLTGVHAETVEKLRKSLSEEANPEQNRRLNKLLVAGLFPGQIRAPRLNLIALPTWTPVKVRFQVLNAQEAFMIWMKAALVSGLVIAAPWVFYQIWLFVAAGLYPHEKNYVYLYLPISILLFLAGASLAFFAVFEPVLNFLFQFNRGMNADFDPRIGEWLSFVLILPIGFGLSFQLPLVMLFLNRIGVVALDVYVNQWRIAILSIFVISMVLTPADPISMLLMALPLCLLYVLGIAMCKYMPQGRNPFAEAYEP